MAIRNAVLVTLVFTLVMTVITVIMFQRAAVWVDQGIVIPLYDRILLSVAVFWRRFWWELVPVFFGVAAAICGSRQKPR